MHGSVWQCVVVAAWLISPYGGWIRDTCCARSPPGKSLSLQCSVHEALSDNLRAQVTGLSPASRPQLMSSIESPTCQFRSWLGLDSTHVSATQSDPCTHAHALTPQTAARVAHHNHVLSREGPAPADRLDHPRVRLLELVVAGHLVCGRASLVPPGMRSTLFLMRGPKHLFL